MLGPVVFVVAELFGEVVVGGILRLPGIAAIARWLKAGGRLTGWRAVFVLVLILGGTVAVLLLAVWLQAEGVTLTAPGFRQWLRSNFAGAV